MQEPKSRCRLADMLMDFDYCNLQRLCDLFQDAGSVIANAIPFHYLPVNVNDPLESLSTMCQYQAAQDISEGREIRQRDNHLRALIPWKTQPSFAMGKVVKVSSVDDLRSGYFPLLPLIGLSLL